MHHACRTIALCSALLPVGCYDGLDGRGNADGAEGGSGDEEASADGSGSDGGDDGGVDADYEPAPVRLRLLLARQYVRSVRDLLGEASSLAVTPPADVAINGFDAVGASQLSLSDAKVDAFEASARAAAAAADDAMIAAHHTCVPTGAGDEACLREFVGSFGRLAFRRTLITEELDSYTGLGLAAATDLGAFDEGVRTVVAAMLQSPNFLYQVEVGEPGDTEGHRRLTGLEMATRLSFFLRDSTPDAALLDLAEAGALDDAQGVRDAAAALVDSTDARLALADFSAELFRIRELATVPKDPTVFPTFTPGLAEAMGAETRALVGHLAFDADADFRDLFDADYTFVDAQLAAHYGLPDPGQYGATFTQVTLPPEQLRGGIFGHAGLMSVLGHVTTTSPTYRGKFIRQQVLCQDIPAPPVGVDTTLPPADEYATMRERLEAHMADPSCAACHRLMDPMGLGLENYDGIGSFRTLENGVTIDATADVDGQPFVGAGPLGAILKDHPDTMGCFVRNLFRHATGHIELPTEMVEIEELTAAFAAGDYRMRAFLIEFVASPAFRVVGDPE